MFEALIQSILGPSGVKILDWYTAHSLLVNGLVVVTGLIVLLFPRQSQKLSGRLKAWWEKTPLALDEKDRQAVEKAKERSRAFQSGKKRSSNK